MATKKRYDLKRRASKIFGHIDNAQEDVMFLYGEFNELKPDYGELLQLISIMLTQAETSMEEFVKHAWLTDKERLEVFRK